MQPDTRYVETDGARVAFQMFGNPPPTVVASAGSFSHTDVIWEDPGASLFYTRLASFCRVLRYDRLGTSNSDPFPPEWDPTWVGYAKELDAVLDAVDTEGVVLMAMLDAGPVAIRYAAERKRRVEKLILYNTSARFVADDDYPAGLPREAVQQLFSAVRTDWGTESQVAMNVPSRMGDNRFASWYAKYVRSIGTPTTITESLRRLFALDVRPWLQQVDVPTLVLHRANYRMVPLAQGRFVAEAIPGARLVELPGGDGPMFWETPDLILDHVRSFLHDESEPWVRTEMAVVLFTDIVRSTEKASLLGDREWAALLGVHDEVVGRVVSGHGGSVVKSTGDGALARFPDPVRAVAGAAQLRRDLAAIGLEIRGGFHAGQVEVHDSDIGGLAVHIAARVVAAAPDGQIVVSRTMRDLLLGSEFEFRSIGSRALKGVDGERELFELS